VGKITRNQLQWVGRNRQPATREELLGAVAGRQLRAESVKRSKDVTALLQLIGRWTDDDFRARCCLGGFSNGVLTILVEHDTLVAPMRRAWTVALMDVLANEYRGAHVADIHFSPGRSDVGFPRP
jgi:hypothetical protein